jgi:adenylate cyclase
LRDDVAMDFSAAGLLDGLEGDERAAREQLLERLAAEGVSLDELRSAVAENRLALLPLDRLLGGRHTAREIEQRTGVPASLVLGIRRLLGLPAAEPDDRVFGDDDVAAAQSTRLFLEAGFGEEAIGEITRVLGEAMARLAAATTAAFVETFLRPGDSEEDVALRFTALAEQLAPALSPVLVAAFAAHLRESVRRGMIGRAERQAGHAIGEQNVTVCFADLVGFTTLGGEVEAQELGSVAARFGELATRVAEPPVRLIKTIGDAAMLVTTEAAPLVGVAISLIEAAYEADLPSVRAGIASGPALVRAGDYFGHSVNLASRVTGIARPGSVLCTQEVRDAGGEDFEWSFAGRHRLKGVAESLPLYRARRRAPATPDGHDAKGAPAARRPRAGRRRRRASS